jgi:hypothetical protein
MLFRSIVLPAGVFLTLGGPSCAFDQAAPASFEQLVAQHAGVHGIPAALVHRVIRAESNYDAAALHRGNYGLMQISYATARSMGYGGPASGLLNANTNLAVAVPYLANAYRVAGGNQERAVRLYRSGFYYAAKRRGLLGKMATAQSIPPEPTAGAPGATSLFAALFGSPAPAAQPVTESEPASDETSLRPHRLSPGHRGLSGKQPRLALSRY